MKKLIFVFVVMFQIASLADQSLISSPDATMIWGAGYIDQHPVFNRSVCQAQIQGISQYGTRVFLEVGAIRGAGPAEPYILVRFLPDVSGPDYHALEMKIPSEGRNYTLMRAQKPTLDGSAVQAVGLARLDERSDLIKTLKAGQSASLSFVKNTLEWGKYQTDLVYFSLKGSTAAINRVIAECFQ